MTTPIDYTALAETLDLSGDFESAGAIRELVEQLRVAQSEIERLNLAEEGAKTAYGHIVDQKQEAEERVLEIEGTIQTQQIVIANLRTERDHLEATWKDCWTSLTETIDERDALQAKLDALEKQEHVAMGWRSKADGKIRDCIAVDVNVHNKGDYTIPLYLAAGAQPVATPEAPCGNTPYDEGPFTIDVNQVLLEALKHVRNILPNEKWADDTKRLVEAAIATAQETAQ